MKKAAYRKSRIVQVVKKCHPFINPEVHYRVHNSPHVVLTLRELNPVHTLIPCFFKCHMLPSKGHALKGACNTDGREQE
jgi:hypothetical protein